MLGFNKISMLTLLFVSQCTENSIKKILLSQPVILLKNNSHHCHIKWTRFYSIQLLFHFISTFISYHFNQSEIWKKYEWHVREGYVLSVTHKIHQIDNIWLLFPSVCLKGGKSIVGKLTYISELLPLIRFICLGCILNLSDLQTDSLTFKPILLLF